MSESLNVQATGPFDSMRDYFAALDARGRLLRIKEIDQDKYMATGLAYKLIDKYGHERAPAFMIDRVKIEGDWFDGPIIGNPFGGWDIEAMAYGIDQDKIVDDQTAMYRVVMDNLFSHMDDRGVWKKIEPVVLNSNKAPCKEVIVKGADVNILKYPWLKTNPADGGRYVNTGAVVIEDPEFGRNVGTYRCHVKGKKKIGMNPSPGHDGRAVLMAKKARGEKTAKVAIALGVDPIIWSLSTTRMAGPDEDELAIAGAVKGKPVELVKCETSDICVPAHAEMIIEGEIPLDKGEDEGPYAELFGYLGEETIDNFYVNITAITHRRQPWFWNAFPADDMLRAPVMASYHMVCKSRIRNFVNVYTYRKTIGLVVLSIDKKFPGEGMAAGHQIIGGPTTKVIIVVDKDINILDQAEVLHAMSARWQPTASLVTPQSRVTLPDPSLAKPGVGSKIIIDATRQLPDEGGPPSWPTSSRVLLEENCPDVFDLVEQELPEYWKSIPQNSDLRSHS